MVAAPRVAARSRLILLLPLLVAGCGILSRQRDVNDDLRSTMQLEDAAARDAALLQLRGAEPLAPPAWLASASVAKDPKEAMALIERGLSFLPDEPNLLLTRLSGLGQLGRREEQVVEARAALARDPSGAVRAQLLWFLIEALLDTGDRDGAEAAALRLGGVPGVPSAIVAATWARIALVREVHEEAETADRNFDASLDIGPAGLSLLRRDSATDPARRAAAARLVERALLRQPDHPDLHIFRLVDQMTASDFDGASTRLAQLPEPFPERLVPEREALAARLLILQGRTEEGLTRLFARLDEEPADPFSLGVLLECWHVKKIPSAEQVAARLRAGRGDVYDPALAAEMDATLKEILAPKKPAGEAPASEPPPSGTP